MSGSKFCRHPLTLGMALCLFSFHLSTGEADVMLDGSLGTGGPLAGPNFMIPDTVGKTVGSNLFHSFSEFNLTSVQSATFTGPAGIANVLGRITDVNPSSIDGLISSTIPGANLFLMNPHGIMFGPNASLDVQGAFHATTADYIGLADGTRFNAIPSMGADSLLNAEPPAAFGFLTANPAPIDVNAGVFDFDFGFLNILQVPVGQTLSFVGGTLNVGSPTGFPPAGFVVAPGGRINLVSVASAGEAAFDGSGFNVDTFAQLGDINIKGGSIVDGREVFIRGGRLAIEDATVWPGFFALFVGLPGPLPDGGGVNIRVANDVTIDAVAPILTDPGIQTFAGVPFDLIPGDVPSIRIDAASLSMSGPSLILATRWGPGNPPDIVANADTISLGSGSFIGAQNFWDGPGGAITFNAETVTLAGDVFAQGDFHPLHGQPGVPFLPEFASAASGSITVKATDNLAVTSATITTDSLAFGASADIVLNVGNAQFSGVGGAVAAQSGLAGDSGNVTIMATGQIDIENGFRISAATGGSGNAGTVSLTAGGSINLTGANSRITGQTVQPLDIQLDSFAQRFDFFFSTSPMFGTPIPDYASLRTALGIAPHPGDLMDVLAALNQIQDDFGLPLTAVPDVTAGDAGKIVINTPVLSMNADTRMETSTGWDGNAGEINANVGSLFLENGASIRSLSGFDFFGTPVLGVGDGGSVNISAANSISISGRSPTSGSGSAISTTTFGEGGAGNVSLSANHVDVQNGGSATSESGGTLAGQFFAGTGDAGSVTITATGPNTLTISGPGSTVSTTTSGAGDGGSISLSSAGNVEILNGGSVSADSLSNEPTAAGETGDITITAGNSITLSNGSISTKAAQADGGEITLTAPNIVQLTNSEITTSIFSQSGANGGNIDIDPEFVILNNSKIIANAFAGQGGNIQITANNFIPSADSVVDASSAFGVQGTVVVASPENNVAASIAQLPQNIVDVSGLLPERCAARRVGAASSSFTVAGRGGVPIDPDGYLPSFTGAGGSPKGSADVSPAATQAALQSAKHILLAMAGGAGCTR